MWLVCTYFTNNNCGGLYAGYAAKLAQSMIAHSIKYEIVSIPDRGSWQANTQYKPTFLKQMLVRYHPQSIVYVDVDAVFLRHPALFDDLDKTNGVNIAVHVLDHSRYRRNRTTLEMLSGTIFLKNTGETARVINEWIEECDRNKNAWDQVALSKVLGNHRYDVLPDRYCKIFDYMRDVQNPVIEHHQASRIAKTVVLRPTIKHK